MTDRVRPRTGPGRLRTHFRSENVRSLVAAAIASLVMFVAATSLAWLSDDVSWSTSIWYGFYITWSLMMVFYTALTVWAFHGLRGDELRSAARGTAAKTRRYASDWSLISSGMALMLVVLLVAVPGLRSNPVLVGFALLMVIACWASMVVSYALHYARQSPEQLGFPEGTVDHSFSDFVYVSFAVQTTFGATDVEIRSSSLRRGVTVHGMLAFAYNTVIVAMIISFLVR